MFEPIKALPKSQELLERFPLSKEAQLQVKKDRKEIEAILKGDDKRLLVVVGPCSAWPEEAFKEYAQKLAELQKELDGKLKLVLRSYTQKARTSKGWPGPAEQADPFGEPDIETGLASCRQLMIHCIEKGLAIADELLFPFYTEVFLDLLSWAAVGARSSEDPMHRVLASLADCPVGLKNPRGGSITSGVNSVVVAQESHVTAWQGQQVKTSGNTYAHLVLRGGNKGPNYSMQALQEAKKTLLESDVKHPALLVDASHENSREGATKDPLKQIEVVKQVLSQLEKEPSLKQVFRGFMIESFLKTGSQDPETLTAESVDRGGLSITDPCLGWPETAQLLKELAATHKI